MAFTQVCDEYPVLLLELALISELSLSGTLLLALCRSDASADVSGGVDVPLVILRFRLESGCSDLPWRSARPSRFHTNLSDTQADVFRGGPECLPPTLALARLLWTLFCKQTSCVYVVDRGEDPNWPVQSK